MPNFAVLELQVGHEENKLLMQTILFSDVEVRWAAFEAGVMARLGCLRCLLRLIEDFDVNTDFQLRQL